MSNLVSRNEVINILDNVEVQAVTATLQKITALQGVIKSTLKSGHDYDTIPGTNKPTLLKPGAEKILMLFGLTSEYEIVRELADYEKGVFAYTVKCILSKNSYKVTEGFGECNSREEKYRYRNVYADNLPAGITPNGLKKDQKGRYKIDNDEIYSLVNTILKMAKKRAQVDATLTVASLSEIFTQDIEDFSEFIKAERVETMTTQDAGEIKITFGKYKGKTIKQIAGEDMGYIEWLANNARAEDVKKAAGQFFEKVMEEVTERMNANGGGAAVTKTMKTPAGKSIETAMEQDAMEAGVTKPKRKTQSKWKEPPLSNGYHEKIAAVVDAGTDAAYYEYLDATRPTDEDFDKCF